MWSNTLHAVIVRDGKCKEYAFHFQGRDAKSAQNCYRCDGLSVPAPFRWFLPSWDADNDLYNLAGALHDWLYATLGCWNVWTRAECDDIFRGIMRESGKSRFKASTADLMVGIFAGCRLHWGNDSYGISDTVRFEVL